ncbi:Zinc phosphodiesterase ELAC protein 2 [Entomortierella chlamydospora]|uniref:ribonuclease Z n=1 Tax=Entomortierella chlamydospora TaxID=101097 RepID=A0A9P6MMY9_9FUNG|nr:Zinc phosphodiesterase ELAC protein 2 [Entomortierella chlamydospora]KAG0008060.1 Zinc phosphodiesterase ELAC protein 2 [Entomortierella chlamydospora]
MKAYIQILSTGTEDCSPSVAFHIDSQRYLVNCGEGTQRLCLESKFRLSKLKTMFFTRVNWETFGGAPGMLLTLSAGEVDRIKLLGGENLTHALVSTRHFVYRNTMAVDTFEFGDNIKTYKDENLRVTAVLTYPENFVQAPSIASPVDESISSEDGSSNTTPSESVVDMSETASTNAGSKRSSGDNHTSHATKRSMTPQEVRKQMLANMFNLSNPKPPTSKKAKLDSRKAKAATDVDLIEAAHLAGDTGCGPKRPSNFRLKDLPRTNPNPVVVNYIFQSPDYVGKFNKDAAIALGVKPGPLFSSLVRGESVLSKSGELVHPHQVISGARPGRVFMVIDCPSVEYLSSLLNAKEFERFQTLDSDSETAASKLQAECIVHLSGHSILNHPEYKAWMERFGPETQHIFANQDFCSQKLIWRSQARSCYRLSKLDPTIFPLPYYNNTPKHDLKDFEKLPIKAKVAESMLSYMLEPKAEWDYTEVVKPLRRLDEQEFSGGEIKPYLQEYYELAEKAKGNIKGESGIAEDFPGSEVVMTALGTGSSHPSKYRNVSSTLVDIPNGATFMLDVGEGTYGQMFRQFGRRGDSADQIDGVDDRIKRLRGIFISHLHADHHLGIVTVIDRWNKLHGPNPESLYVIAPSKYDSFLRELSEVQDFGYNNVKFIHSDDIVFWRGEDDERRIHAQPLMTSLFESSGFSEISTVDVIHCPWAYGISMTHRDGWKIVYSGDTRPCENLVEAGQGATVLLHEATFEDDMPELALAKKHSTTGEAVMVGEGMGAKITMLTHFSQRYPKIPFFEYEDKSTVIGICFDMMSVKLGQMLQLPKYLPALQSLFSPQSEEAEDGEGEGQEVQQE